MKHKKESTPGKKKSFPGMKYRHVSIAVIALLLTGLGVAASLRTRHPAPPAQEGRYEFRGVVQSVDKANKRATIQHDKVGDLMGAMTMPFVIKGEKALNEMGPCDQIKATLVSTDDGRQWLEQITIIARAKKESL
jgi:Cu/Ag efflux protein CusF